MMKPFSQTFQRMKREIFIESNNVARQYSSFENRSKTQMKFQVLLNVCLRFNEFFLIDVSPISMGLSVMIVMTYLNQ